MITRLLLKHLRVVRNITGCCFSSLLFTACLVLPMWKSFILLRTGYVPFTIKGRERLKDLMSAPGPTREGRLETVPERKPLNLSECSRTPPNLVGSIMVSMSENQFLSSVHFTGMGTGGRWRPRVCVARHRVALVVPFRDRWDHLFFLLYYLIPLLKRQQLEFRIFVVEQQGNAPFNKGCLMNVGFLEAMKEGDYQCVIFHDVDLIPENDRNMYSCASNPTHLSVAIDKYDYELYYKELVGGVMNFPIEDFRKVNGFTNRLWCWGSEDDEMWERLKHCNLTVSRPSPEVARYKAIPHLRRQALDNNRRIKLVNSVHQHLQKDGLNRISYNVTSKVNERLYTHLLVDIGQPPVKMPSIARLCMVYC